MSRKLFNFLARFGIRRRIYFRCRDGVIRIGKIVHESADHRYDIKLKLPNGYGGHAPEFISGVSRDDARICNTGLFLSRQRKQPT